MSIRLIVNFINLSRSRFQGRLFSVDQIQSLPFLNKKSLIVPLPSKIAAIDIGSNSFHMVIARSEHNEIRPFERIGEKVQLGSGLEAGQLSADAIERGLDCLRRFQQVLRETPDCVIRAVGTNALRSAHNREAFIQPAEEILGCPIEVIAGREEARLVYLGVAHTQADDEDSRLVIDIGGGSTELIIGQRFEAKTMESLHMGCISFMRYFEGGKITRENFQAAYRAAYLELLQIRGDYLGQWQNCVGSSGTLLAIEKIIIDSGLASSGITAENLVVLQELLLGFDNVEDVDLPGLKESRRHIIASGLAITKALFDALEITVMRLSDGALREGVLFDQLGRLTHEDVRERTVSALEDRYEITHEQIGQVTDVAGHFFSQIKESWQLTDNHKQLLQWASRLYLIGLTVSHSQFHKHGDYLIRHADLPGFSRKEQSFLALLIRSHRRKFPIEMYDDLRKEERRHLIHLAILLRLAVVLRYTAPVDTLPSDITATAINDDEMSLQFPVKWLEDHPLTFADLQEEVSYLNSIGFTLIIE